MVYPPHIQLFREYPAQPRNEIYGIADSLNRKIGCSCSVITNREGVLTLSIQITPALLTEEERKCGVIYLKYYAFAGGILSHGLEFY